jgi:trk system potassium uptake protein TrkH
VTIRRPVERQRVVTRRFRARRPDPSKPFGSGSLTILGGFAAVVVLGTALLTLPIAAENRQATNVYDSLFTTVSALTVTGLVVHDTQAHWSFFGEAVIIGLIQAGGLGYMLGASMALWILGRRLGLRDRHMLRQFYGSPTMGEAVGFAKRVIVFALVVEAAGIVLLWVAFVIADVPAGRSVWWAFFHGISAFNNAGFNVTGQDLVPFRESTPVLGVIATLVVIGGLGAMPVLALLRQREVRRLPIDHKLIYVATAAILLTGTVFILLVEWGNSHSLGGVSPAHRPMVAFFETAMSRTAGFTAVNVSEMNEETRFFIIGLMFIGGAAGSTAGGIKVGTFAILLVALMATMRGRDQVVLFNREVRPLVIRQALTIALLGVAAAFAFATAVAAFSSGLRFFDILFDTVSAIGTVGYSVGTTPDLGHTARALTILAMVVGRFGPLVLVLEMTRPRRPSPYRLPEDSIRLG